ncbi:MAG: hypothetical protein GY827_12540 [Cytophagales bacterium]|nr:hypothetical protein [Cytophagales bacterium]
MKKGIAFLLALGLSSLLFAQTDYDRLMKYHAKWRYGVGLRAGELTGLELQMYRGIVCAGAKNSISKPMGISLVIGNSRTFSSNKFLSDSDTEQVAPHGIRTQLAITQLLFNFWTVDCYVGAAAYGGQRNILNDQQEIKTNFSMGAAPSIGLEKTFLRAGTRNKPIYFNVFAEYTYYLELDKRFFTASYVSAGVKMNFWD